MKMVGVSFMDMPTIYSPSEYLAIILILYSVGKKMRCKVNLSFCSCQLLYVFLMDLYLKCKQL